MADRNVYGSKGYTLMQDQLLRIKPRLTQEFPLQGRRVTEGGTKKLCYMDDGYATGRFRDIKNIG